MKTFKLSLTTKRVAMCAILLSIFFTACRKDRNDNTNGDIIGPNINFFALGADNKLSIINAQTGQSGGQATVTGLQSGETLIAIDFRPATGQLYGLSSGSRIYVIDLKNGAAKQIGTNPLTPTISGTAVGFDFNPTVDRIRIVTSTGQNLRIHPETGAVAFTDGSIATTSKVTSVAYTNNQAGASTTTLFDIDVANDKLYKQDPPNDGTLVEVGSLGIDADEAGGFDISPEGDIALAVLSVGGQSRLYVIDLATGKASRTGSFGNAVIGLAIPTNPVAYAISSANEFIIYNPATGATVTKPITGMQTGENVLGLDTRPANGQLYVLGSSSRVYTLNASSGAATAVGTEPFATLLSGTDFGFDFNPTVDRIRIVSNTGQNLRVHPETGVVAFVDGVLKPGTPSVTAAAYTNNFAGATTTTLFDIDSETNTLYKQDPPNDGTLTSVGALNVNITAANGFDIGGYSGDGFAILSTDAGTNFYRINLTTGAATVGRAFPTGVRGFTMGLGF
ncbi:hypothetical protein GCM10023149_09280 [Mucilaginibacter gynuensis]|uniref:DUF4394 domain-containing protein n=1 Tax=Mucilaginibacter gynuensis TaxID=1302236 RepID=A0ABP8FY98_9SPHI